MKKELNALTMQRRLRAERLTRFIAPPPEPAQEEKTEQPSPRRRRHALAKATSTI